MVTRLPINEGRCRGIIREERICDAGVVGMNIMYCFIVRMKELSGRERNSYQDTIEQDKAI